MIKSNIYFIYIFLHVSFLFSQDTMETNLGIKLWQDDSSEDNLKHSHTFGWQII